ncbi:MAG: hypothetical protein FWG88_01415 [Oscillospiraceae bacterium]|nr:hypothetical protein [Oscillospiraceae bacterium]
MKQSEFLRAKILYPGSDIVRKYSDTKEWRDFVEMCFDPNSPISSKLKETLYQMAGGDE